MGDKFKKSKNSSNGRKSPGMSKIKEEEEATTSSNIDSEINSGFSQYLRSNEGKRFQK